MIPLISTKDRTKIVFSTDPDVTTKSNREPCRALPIEETKINGGAPLVVTVRPLSSRETMRIYNPENQAEIIWTACELAVCRIDAGKKGSKGHIAAHKTAEIVDLLDSMPPDVVTALGAFVINLSTGVSEDPT